MNGQNDSKERQGVGLASLKAEKAGFVLRETHHSDYGVDAYLEQRQGGRISGRILAAQIKAGASYFSEQSADAIVFRFSEAHAELWRKHTAPVVVLLCDLEHECVYWADASKAVKTSAGRWRLDISKDQILGDGEMGPVALCTPATAYDGIRLLEEKDVSFGAVRRVTIRAEVLPGPKGHNRAMFEEAIESVRILGETSTYFRDHISRSEHAGKAAEVVFGFLYGSGSDVEFGVDWICKFVWVHPSCPDAFRPIARHADATETHLQVDWREGSKFIEFVDARRSSKGDYLAHVDEIIPLLEQVLQTRSREALSRDTIQLLSEIEHLGRKDFYRPHECARLDDTLGAAMAVVGNLKLYSKSPQQDARMRFLVRQQFEMLEKDVGRLRIYREDVV